MAIVITRTNITRINFVWTHPGGAERFVMRFGGTPGIYTNTIVTGATNGYSFRMTNWVERAARHWFVVAAVFGSVTSAPSNETFAPPYPADHIHLEWRTNWASTTVLTSTNLLLPLDQWQTAGVVKGDRCFVTNLLAGSHFYVINRRDTLTVDLFNPMNLALGQNICTTNVVAPHQTITTLGITGGNLSWTFTGPQPVTWEIQFRQIGTSSWTELDAVDGGDSSYLASLDPNTEYQIIPWDDTASPMGPSSNIVQNP